MRLPEEDLDQYLAEEKPQIDALREKIGQLYDLLKGRNLHLELEAKPLRLELIGLLFSLAEHYEFHHYEKEECLLKIIGLDKENVVAYIKLGETYNHNNALNKAIKYYEKALEIIKNKIKEIKEK